MPRRFFELGYPYGVLMDWYHITGPKGMSPAVAKTLKRPFSRRCRHCIQGAGERLYMQVRVPLTGQKFREYVEQIYKQNGDIIRRPT